ncbi:Bifunctional NMN adenylyltransferase/Nudix hydrolase [compost metagenome]
MSHAKMKPEAAVQYSNEITSENVDHTYDLAVCIMRAEPYHIGHQVLVNQGLAVANHVLVLVGSSNVPRTIKNPFTYDERMEMILGSLSVADRTRVGVLPVPDCLYSDDDWITYVQQKIENTLTLRVGGGWEDKKVNRSACIVGNKKDESSYYLDKFPQYDFVSVDGIKLGLDATSIRQLMFEAPDQLHLIKSLVPASTFSFVERFIGSDEHTRLGREYDMIKKYKAAWAAAPYAPTFVTVDAVVKKNGHVLFVRRKAAPGEGLLALPGGFVNQNERLRDAAIRELIEETSIDLPPGLLANSISRSDVFDHPDRSLRGRTFTHAFLFDLDKADSKSGLPKVKGGDDAAEAIWIPTATAINMAMETYEDHQSIWRSMVGV